MPLDGIGRFQLARIRLHTSRPKLVRQAELLAGKYVRESHDLNASAARIWTGPEFAVYAATMDGYVCAPATAAALISLARSLNHRAQRRLQIARLERVLARPCIVFDSFIDRTNKP